MSDERELQPRIRRVAAATQARGKKRIMMLTVAAATDRLVIEERTTTKISNNESVLTSVSCVGAVAMLAWCPREHTQAPQIEDDRVEKEGALQPRLVPLRLHKGGVHGPVQKLLVKQDDVDVLEQDAVHVLHYGSTQKKTAVQTTTAR